MLSKVVYAARFTQLCGMSLKWIIELIYDEMEKYELEQSIVTLLQLYSDK